MPQMLLLMTPATEPYNKSKARAVAVTLTTAFLSLPSLTIE